MTENVNDKDKKKAIPFVQPSSGGELGICSCQIIADYYFYLFPTIICLRSAAKNAALWRFFYALVRIPPIFLLLLNEKRSQNRLRLSLGGAIVT